MAAGSPGGGGEGGAGVGAAGVVPGFGHQGTQRRGCMPHGPLRAPRAPRALRDALRRDYASFGTWAGRGGSGTVAVWASRSSCSPPRPAKRPRVSRYSKRSFTRHSPRLDAKHRLVGERVADVTRTNANTVIASLIS